MQFIAAERKLLHTVNHDNLFNDVMSLFKTKLHPLEKEFPFRVKFKVEMGLDTGGVTCDTYVLSFFFF